jgi:hypothetical protein
MQVDESILVTGILRFIIQDATVMQPRHMYTTLKWSNPMLHYMLANIFPSRFKSCLCLFFNLVFILTLLYIMVVRHWSLPRTVLHSIAQHLGNGDRPQFWSKYESH